MRLVGILFCIVTFFGMVFAQTIQMQATETQLSVDSPVQVTIKITDALQAGEVFIQGIEQFDVLGQSQSQTIQVINGQQSAQVQLQLQIQPKKSGTVLLGPAMITGGSGSIQSNTLTFTVTGERLFLQPHASTLPSQTSPLTKSQSTMPVQEEKSTDFGSLLRWLMGGLFAVGIGIILRGWRRKNSDEGTIDISPYSQKVVHFPTTDDVLFRERCDEWVRNRLSMLLHRDVASVTFGELTALISDLDDAKKSVFLQTLEMIQQAHYTPDEPDREIMKKLAFKFASEMHH